MSTDAGDKQRKIIRSSEMGIGLGIALGLALGAAFNNIGLGLAIGIGLGAGLSFLFSKKQAQSFQSGKKH